MARVRVAALLVGAGVLFAGCSAFFQFNAFASLDKPPAPTAADYEGVGGLLKLEADLNSPAVVQALAADPATVAQIKAYLGNTYGFLSGTPTTPDQQTAAALYSDLSLKTTSGDTLVNNVVTAIMSTPPTGNISSIITSIIPASVLADSTGASFAAMVEGLLDAEVAYENLGVSIGSYGAPPGMNLGDVAQKAAVAYLMSVVVQAVRSSPPTYTRAEAEAQMFLLVTNNPACTITGVTVSSDPLNPLPAWLQSIFSAGGVPAPV